MERWTVRYGKTPIWYYIRPIWQPLLVNPSVQPYITLNSFFKSVFSFFYFILFKQFFVDSVYFTVARKDCVDFHTHISLVEKCELFVQYENSYQAKVHNARSADFLNGIRFFFRLVAKLNRREASKILSQLNFSKSEDNLKYSTLICSCIGDWYYNRFLSIIFRRHLKIYYACSVIPQVEKFEHLMDSYEVQHGVIHSDHFSYANVPDVKNGIITYHSIYENVLNEIGYSGQVKTVSFRQSHRDAEASELFDVVLFTAPNGWRPALVNAIVRLLKLAGKNVRLQKHPRDTEIYDLEDSILIRDTHPSSVKIPILFHSTIIEDYIVHGKEVVIFDPTERFDLFNDPLFSIYRRFSQDSKLMHFKTVDDVVAYCLKRLST